MVHKSDLKLHPKGKGNIGTASMTYRKQENGAVLIGLQRDALWKEERTRSKVCLLHGCSWLECLLSSHMSQLPAEADMNRRRWSQRRGWRTVRGISINGALKVVKGRGADACTQRPGICPRLLVPKDSTHALNECGSQSSDDFGDRMDRPTLLQLRGTRVGQPEMLLTSTTRCVLLLWSKRIRPSLVVMQLGKEIHGMAQVDGPRNVVILGSFPWINETGQSVSTQQEPQREFWIDDPVNVHEKWSK